MSSTLNSIITATTVASVGLYITHEKNNNTKTDKQQTLAFTRKPCWCAQRSFDTQLFQLCHKHGFGSPVPMQEITWFVCEQGSGFAVYFIFFLSLLDIRQRIGK